MRNCPVGPPPNFFSLAFHTKFFPALLWRRLRPKREEYQFPFQNHFPIELMILLAGSAILLAVGIPNRSSIIGWIMVGFGMAGIIALFIHSILSEVGTRPSFAAFRPIIFSFFVVSGITAGSFFGFVEHSSWLAVFGGLTGFLVGYVVGIFAGLWLQYLGWVGGIFDVLAIGGIIGMVVLNLVLLFYGPIAWGRES